MIATNLTRRSLLGAGALFGLAALVSPPKRAEAWSSWTNATSTVMERSSMGDCLHEDLVQIAYARVLRNHATEAGKEVSLLNPWAGEVQGDARYATIAGDMVDAGEGRAFSDASDLATHLYRENLAYLRIGSYWNDAAVDTLVDYANSCFYADSVPKFSGANSYEGAWDVGQHLYETDQANQTSAYGLDALMQFSANDRAGFIHGMLSSTADHSNLLEQSEVKRFVLQWLGVAYEYARTGEVTETSDVSPGQAERIFRGLVDTYGQLDADAHDTCVSLQVSSNEASVRLPRRRLRLRALGMMCHTLEDLWCPAHTCRMYHDGDDAPRNSILAFCNQKMQNGHEAAAFGYHVPFDRYAISDSNNPTNWREALTRGDNDHGGTETLENALGPEMDCLGDAHTYFNTLGMNEAIDCVTRLLEYLYQGTAWDDGVRAWVDTEVMPTYFDEDERSLVCDAGRRSLHTPTYLIAPIQAMGWAYRKASLSENHTELLDAAKAFNHWQHGAHRFFSGAYNTNQSKRVESGYEGDSIWDDDEGECRLAMLVDKLYEGYGDLGSDERGDLLLRIGCNGCHDMVGALDVVSGMLQEFNIDLRGGRRSGGDEVMQKIDDLRTFFASGVMGTGEDEGDEERFVTSRMALESLVALEDGSYLIAVRNMDSLETSIMVVPEDAPGRDMLKDGIANLTIAYTLQTEFADDLDYRYIVSDIDCSDMEEDVYLDTCTVLSVSSDARMLTLDVNGLGESKMPIGDGMTDLPPTGAYVCARYVNNEATLELVHCDELDDPGELKQVTYPVARVNGSNLWLLTNEDCAEDGYRDFLVVDYGRADVYTVPQEGQCITVYYHDEPYGEQDGADEGPLGSSALGAGSGGLLLQDVDDELTDSVVPGYLELGDDAGRLDYGSEVFHIANVIMSPDERPVIPSREASTDDPTPNPGSEPKPEPEPQPEQKPQSPASDAGDAGRPKPSASKLPDTGDPFAGMGDWAAAAAAMGGVVSAYSARRMANDREDSEGE